MSNEELIIYIETVMKSLEKEKGEMIRGYRLAMNDILDIIKG